MHQENNKECFVIMPFRVREPDLSKYNNDTNHWNEVYNGLIEPAINQAGFSSIRDDIDIGSRIIQEDVLRKIEKSDIILCDLSSSNPNVFLELGWALRGDKPYVLIKDKLTTFEFDLNQNYTLEYSQSLQPMGIKSDIQKLVRVIQQTYQDKKRRYSIVSKLSISLSAIESASKGDGVTGLLLEIRNKLANPQTSYLNLTQPRIPFLWPNYLRQGLVSLFSVKREIESKNLQVNLINNQNTRQELNSIVTRLGLRNKPEIQLSLIDENRIFIFHDQDGLVNSMANATGKENFNIYDEVFNYPSGAVAWSDIGTNIIGQPPVIRNNIGIWTTLNNSNARLFIELHHEILS